MAGQIGSDESVARLASKGLEIIKQITDIDPRSTRPTKKLMLLSDFDSAGFDVSDSTRRLILRLSEFMDQHIFPLEAEMESHVKSEKRWQIMPQMERLKLEAQQEGLWNLFIPPDMAAEIHQMEDLSMAEKIALSGYRLKNVEYCFLAELMGRCLWASEVFNCSAPDTGNMEILSKLEASFSPQLEIWC